MVENGLDSYKELHRNSKWKKETFTRKHWQFSRHSMVTNTSWTDFKDLMSSTADSAQKYEVFR